MIFITLGVPGSGRTYLAKHLAKTLGAFHLQSDEIRTGLYDEPERFSQQDIVVSRMSLLLLNKLIDMRMSVVIDGDYNRRVSRQQLRAVARENGYGIVTLWVQTDVETAYMRANKRDRRVTEEKYAIEYTEDAYDQELARFQSPQYEKVAVISGKHAYSTQLRTIKKKLDELGYLKNESRGSLKAMSKVQPKISRDIHSRRRLIS